MKKFPKRAKTLTNIIRCSNPWRCGYELAKIIEDEWENIKGLTTIEVESYLKNLTSFKTFCEEHHLAFDNVLYNGIFKYL